MARDRQGLHHIERRAGENVRRERGLSVFRLKAIGLVLVTLGTLNTSLIMRDITNVRTADMSMLTTAVILDALSWMAIPIFAWLVVSGVHHSSSMGRYVLRVALLALVSEVPYDLATSGRVWDMSSQNPVWAILAGLILVWVYRAIDPNPPHDSYSGRHFQWAASTVWMVRLLVALAAFLWMGLLNVGSRLGFVNEGVITIVMVLCFELLHRHENTMMYTAALLGALMFLTPGLGVMFVHFHNDRTGYEHHWTGIAFYIAYLVQLLVCVLLRFTV